MRSRTSRGFTLIELMITVAIVGVLSSVAIPSYQNMTLRTRKTEREFVMTSIKRSVSGLLVRDGDFRTALDSDWNPDAEPGTRKRPIDATREIGELDDGKKITWAALDLSIEGAVYHSYMFTAEGTSFHVLALGDLDGDGVEQTKGERYRVADGALTLAPSTEEAPNPYFDPLGDIAF